MSLYEDDFLWAGDLEEEFRERAAGSSPRKAKLWYGYQLLKSLPAYSKYLCVWSYVMFKNYCVTALRNIRRQKGYSLLNLGGLAIGLACFILISIYIQYELSFDRYHAGAGQIYRVCGEHPFYYHGKNQAAITPAPLAPALKSDLPEVLASVRLTDEDDVLLSSGDKHFLEESIFYASPGIFEVFSFQLYTGDPENALSAPYSIILSERMAEKYFAQENAIGKTIKLKARYDLKVTGVLKNIPTNSHYVADFILPFSLYGVINNEDFTSWSHSSYYTYIKLRDDTLLKDFESHIQTYMERSFRPGQDRQGFRYFLQPLTDIHLHSDVIAEINANSDIKNIYIFGFIAILILIIACMNYMNLVTARSAQRSKEVGIRKVVGALRNQVIKQFFAESILLTFLALILASFLVFLLLPLFGTFVNKDLNISIMNNPQILFAILALIFFVGVFAGSYPALIISSFRPAKILRSGSKSTPKGISLRNGLVVIQFSISILLIICTLVVRNQLNFIKNKDVGYQKDQIITMRIRDPEIRQNIKPIKTELLDHPYILSASASSNLPHRITNLGRVKSYQASDEEYFPMYQCTVDYDFFDLFGIEITTGRKFSKDFASDTQDAYILNETAVKALGYSNPLDKEFIEPIHGGTSKRGRIIGVMKDFNMLSLHLGIEPLKLGLDPNESQRYLSIKLQGNEIPKTIKFIKEKFEMISSTYPFEYQFFDDVFSQVYENEQKVGQLLNAFGLLAIFIACLGLYGLASFTTEQKTKEIGIRKVLGASISGIILLLTKEFTKWVLVANFVAWPVAFFLMKNWLQNFAYQIPLSVGIFFLAGAFAFGLAFLTVLFQTLRAAKANPIAALKYE